jgi:putative ABC transport system substrate-binding protein
MGGMALGGLGLAQAQVQTTPSLHPRILLITFRGETDIEKGFRAYLANAGLNCEYMVRDVRQNVANVPAILEEAVAFKPDLIYTWGTGVTLAVTGKYEDPAHHALSQVPVVFAPVAAPVQAHIVPSLSGQGRNVTGVVHVVPTLVQMKAMQSYLPFKKIGLLYTPTELNSKVIVDEVQAYCQQSGLELLAHKVKLDDKGKPTADGMEEMVADLRKRGAQWFYLLPDTFLGTVMPRMCAAAQANSLPTFAAAELAIRSGGVLVGLVSRYYSVGQLAAAKAIEILVNKKPASSVSIETLKRFSLIVNMDVARNLGGVYPPIDMLNYAEIIGGAKVGT